MKCPSCQHDNPDAIPKERLTEESTKRQQFEAEVKRLAPLANQATALTERVTQLTKDLEGRDAHHARELAFTEAGLKSPSVRKVMGDMFDAQAATEGGEKDAAKWLQAQQELLKTDASKVDPVIAALMPRAGANGGGTGGGAGGQSGIGAGQGKGGGGYLPNTSKGAGGKEAGAPPAYTKEQIDNMSPEDFVKNLPAISAANPGMGIPSRLPWGPPPKPEQQGG
jgi:hypothetical protein